MEPGKASPTDTWNAAPPSYDDVVVDGYPETVVVQGKSSSYFIAFALARGRCLPAE